MTAEAAVVLRVAHATRRFADQLALDDVSLEIRTSEVYALIGRNGAGKSTLVKAAIGALALDKGTVRVMGDDPAKASTSRRAIGVAPQEIALYPHLSIAENLDAFAALSGVAKPRASAISEATAQTACAERAHDRVDRLSGGWRRRANLAAAIVHQPQLLILDEPTEGLDAETRTVLHRLIALMRQQKTAILLISHNAEDIASLADRVGVLRGGRLVAEGTPADLMTRAFGDRQELTVRLSAAIETADALFRKMGLASLDAGLSWSGLIHDAPAQAVRIDQELRAAAISVRELAVRPPGLDALIGWAEDHPSS